MTEPNLYRSPADADRRPTNGAGVRVTILAVVLLDVALSVYTIVSNLPDLLRSPDSSVVVISATLVFWTAWIVAELFAARLIWRGRAAGRWILVVSFGLKGIGQIVIVWPLLVRAPSLILGWPWLKFAIKAVGYCVATIWLLLLPAFEKRAAGESGTSSHFGDDQSAKESFMAPN
jgi:hypothetical protein